ncbi:hypothetical protein ABZ553_14410 [Streptomyces sparsogenes]|uniref:hypothetical protein n=1 Tax=Streptomyces sparsogenes TaxID=67365 RepID=UPI00340B29EC
MTTNPIPAPLSPEREAEAEADQYYCACRGETLLAIHVLPETGVCHDPNPDVDVSRMHETLKAANREAAGMRASGERLPCGIVALLKDVPTLLDTVTHLRLHVAALAERDVALNAAERRVAELERPAVEGRRNAIRDSYQELAAQAREERDYEGEARALHALEAREAQWAAEDAKAGDR